MSQTPRTDLMVSGNSDPSADEYADLSIFCRQLERETITLQSTLSSHEQTIERMTRCLVFFRSVIMSGEEWSETCEREYTSALSSSPVDTKTKEGA